MSDKFSYVKRGYDPEEVERYVEGLETVLRSYKEKDSAIKNAIINAQIAADNIVKDAKQDAERMKQETIRKMDEINASISEQKRFVGEFQSDYNKMIGKYIQQFNDTDILRLYSRINELEEYMVSLGNTAESIDIE